MTSANEEAPLLGRTIAGKFALDRYLGGGAMGAVYRAHHVQLETQVALKILHPDLSKDPTFSQRFMREARTAFRIDHPNSLRVIDFGEEADGLLYIAMEHLDGCDLFALLRRDWPLETERIADIMMQMLGALASAHDLGIVHRDVKPENIMVLERKDDEGRPRDLVKVCDFGIAKMMQGPKQVGQSGPKITARGMIVGTPEYMSPEQGRGEELDPRSDIYSAGIILYQMLTRTLPFEGDAPLPILLKHITDKPTPPSSIAKEIDPRLEAICLRALEKDRDARFASAREMRAELRAVLDASRASALSIPPDDLPTTESIPVPLSSKPLEGRSEDVPAPNASIPPAEASRRILHARQSKESLRVPAPRRATGWLVGGLLIAGTLGSVFFLIRKGALSRPPDQVHAQAQSTVAGPLPSGTPIDPKSLASTSPVTSLLPAVLGGPSPSASTPGPLPLASLASSSKSVRPLTGRPAASGTASAVVSLPEPTVAPSSVAPTGDTYLPQRASVELGATVGAASKAVRKVVPLSLFSQCYREDLGGVTKPPAAFGVTMTMKTNAQGQIVSTSFSGAWGGQHPQELAACVTNNMATGGKIAGAGAGVVSAELSFRP